jgi:nicotinamidase-related amidase
MADGLDLVPRRTAVLALDFTPEIVKGYAFDGEACVVRAAEVCAAARQVGAQVAHVTPGPTTADGYHPGIAPEEGDLTFVKSRIGAFSTTGLDVSLRAAGRDCLLIMGVATSGTVLSTSRWASDAGYRAIVVADGCSDPDEEVHKLLTEPAYHPTSWVGLWRIAEVVPSVAAVAALS